jgi:hypothetical protein
MTMTRRRRPRAGALIVAAAAVGTVVAATVAATGFGGSPADGIRPGDPSDPSSGGTARITRQTLVDAATVSGKLDYGPAEPVESKVTGTVTWLPAVGMILTRGDVLLRADEKPVVMFYGALPMYRELREGITGRDVEQFESNLRALGHVGFAVDKEFNRHTAAAVKRWQRDLEVPQTGVVDVARVVYAPGAVRVAGRSVRVGGSAAGEVLTYTANTKVVTVDVPAAGAAWAAKGTKVTVALPGAKIVPGTVTRVGSDATAAPPAGESGSGDAPTPASEGATVPVTVSIADQTALGSLQSTPVDVRYTTEERKDVLTVPVAALLAPQEGGYAVEIVEGSETRIVAVRTGLFADGRVEVRGRGIRAGTAVRMPW